MDAPLWSDVHTLHFPANPMLSARPLIRLSWLLILSRVPSSLKAVSLERLLWEWTFFWSVCLIFDPTFLYIFPYVKSNLYSEHLLLFMSQISTFLIPLQQMQWHSHRNTWCSISLLHCWAAALTWSFYEINKLITDISRLCGVSVTQSWIRSLGMCSIIKTDYVWWNKCVFFFGWTKAVFLRNILLTVFK